MSEIHQIRIPIFVELNINLLVEYIIIVDIYVIMYTVHTYIETRSFFKASRNDV